MKLIKLAVLASLVFSLITPASQAADTYPEAYALTCSEDAHYGRLSKLAADFNGSTEIGNFSYPSDSMIDCAGPGAYNPADDHLYWVSWYANPGALIKTNPVTGASTVIGVFTIEGQSTGNWAYAIAFDENGDAYVAVDGLGIYSVDLETADLTEVASSVLDEPYGFAYDYSTGRWIIVVLDRSVFEFDPIAKSVSPITEGHYVDLVTAFGKNVYALAFDLNGDAYDLDSALTKVSAADYTKTTWGSEVLNLLGVAAYAESLFFKLDFPKSDSDRVSKRIWAIKDGKLTSAGKAKIRKVSADRDAATIVCSVRKRRDFSVSFKADSKAAQVLATQACAIANASSPDAVVITRGWVVGKKPIDTVKIQFKG